MLLIVVIREGVKLFLLQNTHIWEANICDSKKRRYLCTRNQNGS